jgi:hypothetical protein
MRVIGRVLVFVVLWLIFESLISWLATCDPASHDYGQYKAPEDYCSSFKGPLILFSRVFLTWLGRLITDEHDALTALGTLVIALFTFTLWRATDRLWKAGERQLELTRAIGRRQNLAMAESNSAARQAAGAAERSAEALINAERAHLFVVIEKHNLREALRSAAFYGESNSPNMQDSQIPSSSLSFFIKNMGRSAAILTEASYRLAQRDFEYTNWEYALEDTIVDPVIEGGSRTDPPTPCDIESAMKLSDGAAALNGTRPLFFWGFVGFRDSFKRQYRYFWRYEYRGRRFVLVYEYEQKTSS